LREIGLLSPTIRYAGCELNPSSFLQVLYATSDAMVVATRVVEPCSTP
jgi:hypothetical protein